VLPHLQLRRLEGTIHLAFAFAFQLKSLDASESTIKNEIQSKSLFLSEKNWIFLRIGDFHLADRLI